MRGAPRIVAPILAAVLVGAVVAAPSVAAASPPTITPSAPVIEVEENHLAILTGTYADGDGDTVSLSASAGTMEKQSGTSSGTWRWSAPATDGPAEVDVTVTADDGNGGIAEAAFTFRTLNVAPYARTYGPRYVPSASLSSRWFEWEAGDVAPDDIVETVTCGNGTKVGEGTTTQVDRFYVRCKFTSAGDTKVGVTASDKDGASADGRITTTATSNVRSVADGRLIIDGVADPSPSIDASIGGALALVDLNDDGFEDVVIGSGAPDQNTVPGVVTVVFGRSGPAHLSLGTATGVARITGEAEARIGDALANAGDVNGDGIDDLVIGAPWATTPGRMSPGSAYVVFGAKSFSNLDLDTMPADRGFRILGRELSQTGAEVAGVGDIDDDGFDDIGVGAPAEGEFSGGAAYVIRGRSAPTDVDLESLAADRGIRIAGVALETGSSIAGGDINDDGRSDVVIAGSSGWGSRAVVIYGRATPVDVDASTLPASSGFSLGIGGGLSIEDLAVGDMDADGFSDVAIAHGGWDGGGDASWAASVVRGQKVSTSVEYLGDWPASRLMKIHADQDDVGLRLATGDWDRDGRVDLVIGSWTATQNGDNSGSAYVVLGRASLTAVDLRVLDSRWRRVDADVPYSLAGSAVAVGDVTGDGTPDLAIGAPDTTLAADGAGGQVAIIAGSRTDSSKPSATAPRHALGLRGSMTDGRLIVNLTWSGADTGSGVDRYDIAQSVDGGAWTGVGSVSVARSARSLAYNHSYRFRVRAVDRAGNVGSWMYGSTFRLSGYHDNHASIRYSSGWKLASSPSYWGSRTRYASSAGRSATFTFTGRAFIWIAAKGPNRGLARIYVNGVLDATVTLESTTTKTRQIPYGKAWSSSGTRSVRIVVVGTSGHPRVDLDGFVTLR